MTWYEEQLRQQNMEDYQSYKITQELKGKMSPSREGVVRMLNSKRKDVKKWSST